MQSTDLLAKKKNCMEMQPFNFPLVTNCRQNLALHEKQNNHTSIPWRARLNFARVDSGRTTITFTSSSNISEKPFTCTELKCTYTLATSFVLCINSFSHNSQSNKNAWTKTNLSHDL